MICPILVSKPFPLPSSPHPDVPVLDGPRTFSSSSSRVLRKNAAPTLFHVHTESGILHLPPACSPPRTVTVSKTCQSVIVVLHKLSNSCLGGGADPMRRADPGPPLLPEFLVCKALNCYCDKERVPIPASSSCVYLIRLLCHLLRETRRVLLKRIGLGGLQHVHKHG